MNTCLYVSCLKIENINFGISIEQAAKELGRCKVEVVAGSGTLKLSIHPNDLDLVGKADALLVIEDDIPFKRGDVLTLVKGAGISNGKYTDFRFSSNKDKLSRHALNLLEVANAA